jgi:hypothetical protein
MSKPNLIDLTEKEYLTLLELGFLFELYPEATGKIEEDIVDNPYCKKCGSCGDSGCCSPSKCEDVKCLYGQYNVREYFKLYNDFQLLYGATKAISEMGGKLSQIAQIALDKCFRPLPDIENPKDFIVLLGKEDNCYEYFKKIMSDTPNTSNTSNTSDMDLEENMFITSFNVLAKRAYENARKKGWWDERDALIDLTREYAPELTIFAEKAIAGMSVALVHSEISEALEGLREDSYDDKIPEFTSEEAEYADAIIRIADRAAAKGLRVAEALVAKMKMNKTRSYKHGGKKF